MGVLDCSLASCGSKSHITVILADGLDFDCANLPSIDMESTDSPVSLSEVEHAFTSEFSGASSFYALLEQRQRRSPLYLRRHTRVWRQRQYPTGISIDWSNLRDHNGNRVETGLLILASMSVNVRSTELSGLIVLKAVVIEDITSATGTHEMMQCINEGSDANLLGIMYIDDCGEEEGWPSRNESNSENFDALLRQFVFARISALLRNKKEDKHSNCKVCVIHLLPKKCKTLSSVNRHASKQPVLNPMKSSNAKMNWFAPSCPTFTNDSSHKRRHYVLSRKPRAYSKSVACERSVNEKDEDLSIDIAVKWKDTLRPPKVPKKIISSAATSGIIPRSLGVNDIGDNDRAQSTKTSSSSSSSSYSQCHSSQVYHHFLCNIASASGEEEHRCVSEASVKLTCPWCSYYPGEALMVSGSSKAFMNIALEDDGDDENIINNNNNNRYGVSIPHQSFRILINHISNNHDYFNHEFAFDQLGNFHSVITRDTSRQLHSLEELRKVIHEHHYVFGSKQVRKDLMQFAVAHTYVEPPKSVASCDDEDRLIEPNAEKNSGDQKRFKFSASASRGFYHSRTGVPIHEDELGYDSDNDVDESQDLCMNNAMLEEFDDVSYEEKVFMMMWHSHLKSFPYYADLYIPWITERFTRKHAPDLVHLGLRHNFLLHLITLWDYGLISSEDIESCILHVDKFAAGSNNSSPASLTDSKID